MIKTLTYSDGTKVTGMAPLPKRSPAQQERDHVCSLRRQLAFLEGRPISSGHTRREIPALRWAIENLERLVGNKANDKDYAATAVAAERERWELAQTSAQGMGYGVNPRA